MPELVNISKQARVYSAQVLSAIPICINARRARATAFPYKEDLVSRARV